MKALDILGKYAHSNGMDFAQAFSEMLDFFIETFDAGKAKAAGYDYSSLLKEREESNHQLFDLLISWIQETTQGIREEGAYDFFGTMYEEAVKGKFKSAVMGQFFTPLSICRAMAETINNPKALIVNDSACGSGRTLLAYFAEYGKGHYYYGEDLDPICVKMCTLNMMIHGMPGEVIHHDALEQNFITGYEVNELMWPMATPFPTIRKISEQEWRRNLARWHRYNEHRYSKETVIKQAR